MWKRCLFAALFAVVFGFAAGTAQEQERRTFTVATWNIRSGHGIAGLQQNPPFDSNTKNCSDPARPRNAWGVGFTQRFLQSDVARDPDVVALGLQESWGNCGNVKNIAAVLGWSSFAPARNGVGMVTRYGIVGSWDQWKIESKGVDGATDDRWMVGGNVCLVPGCSRTTYMWTTHLSPTAQGGWPEHVAKVLAWLGRKPRPHLFFGDLNLWQNDAWSPRTTCGRAIPQMAFALARIRSEGYVDAWAATQKGPGWTGMTSRRGCGPERNGGLYKRIDYVWSKDLTPLSAARIGVVEPGAPAPSDHLGLKAQYAMPGTR